MTALNKHCPCCHQKLEGKQLSPMQRLDLNKSANMANNALTAVRVVGVGVLFFNGTPVEKTMTTNEQQTMSTLLSSFNFCISSPSKFVLNWTIVMHMSENVFFKPIISQFCIGDG